MEKLSQAALEFLITYAWAFLVIIILIGVLVYLGVLSPTKFLPDKCEFGSEFGCIDYVVSSNGLQVKLKNNIGHSVVIENLSVYSEKSDEPITCLSPVAGMVLAPEEILDTPVSCSFSGEEITQGEKAKLNLEVKYHATESSALFSKSVKGTVQIKVTSNTSYDYLAGARSGQGTFAGLIAAYDFESNNAVLNDISLNSNDGTIWGNTIYLSHFDGNANDISPYGNDGILEGGMNCSELGITGESCGFDAVDDVVRLSAPVAGLPDTEITVAAWVRLQSHVNWYDLISNDWGYNGPEAPWLFYTLGNSYASFGLWPKQGASPGQKNANGCGTEFTLNEWHHMVGTYDSSIVKVYLDGQECTTTSTASYPLYSAGTVYIGERGAGSTTHHLDELGIYSRAFTGSEISNLYNKRKAIFSDLTEGKYGNALEFDGVDDYIEINDQDSLDFGLSPFSIEAWFKTTSTTREVIIGNNYAGSTGTYIEIDTSGKARFIVNIPGGTPDIVLTSSNSYNDGGWHHVVGVRTNTEGILYIDGQEITRGGTVENIMPTQLWHIGAMNVFGNPNYFFDGSIDSLAIYNRALSEDEIALRANS